MVSNKQVNRIIYLRAQATMIFLSEGKLDLAAREFVKIIEILTKRERLGNGIS